ncbi:MAG: Methyltransferase, FkbM family [Nitrospira sp.]|nr:Methyltransferase, FkbM family [Nitrospira sp.]
MVTNWLKLFVRKLLAMGGVELRRIAPVSAARTRNSLLQLLEQARSVGFSPRTVIDVGAAYGSFTRLCHGVFPGAHYLLIEPLDEYRSLLEQVTHAIPSSRYRLGAACARNGQVEINVHPDLVGSSLYREVETGTGVNGVPRSVRAVTVDAVVREAEASGPFLLKLDVQGAELDALEGAEKILDDCEFVVLEVSFFKFFEGGPECAEMIGYMKHRGFVPYDIVGLQYRPLDRALSQADIAFVKEHGLFRREHAYATAAQRDAQNTQMQRYLDQLFAGRS